MKPWKQKNKNKHKWKSNNARASWDWSCGQVPHRARCKRRANHHATVSRFFMQCRMCVSGDHLRIYYSTTIIDGYAQTMCNILADKLYNITYINMFGITIKAIGQNKQSPVCDSGQGQMLKHAGHLGGFWVTWFAHLENMNLIWDRHPSTCLLSDQHGLKPHSSNENGSTYQNRGLNFHCVDAENWWCHNVPPNLQSTHYTSITALVHLHEASVEFDQITNFIWLKGTKPNVFVKNSSNSWFTNNSSVWCSTETIPEIAEIITFSYVYHPPSWSVSSWPGFPHVHPMSLCLTIWVTRTDKFCYNFRRSILSQSCWHSLDTVSPIRSYHS